MRCPHCDQKIPDKSLSPLEALKSFLRGHFRKADRDVKIIDEIIQEEEGKRDRKDQRSKAVEKAHKWFSWIQAIEELENPKPSP